MLVDFHVHSTASDGTCSPAELVQRAHGFAALALTDHDNCEGVSEFLSASSEDAVRRIAGIELSIDPGKGFDKFHLLGLGIDPQNVELRTFLRNILDGRNARNIRILENFRRLGIEMPDIRDYAHGEVLARPHFARWLMVHGLVPDIRTAFARYLLPDSPPETRCYEERFHPAQEEAFRVIHAAGGLCVMAHPKYWRMSWREKPIDLASVQKELAAMKERGLDGLEALYEANSVEENIAFTHLADDLHLLKTAGSDFHGANKPTTSLGMTVPSAFIAPVLERL